MVLWGFLNGFFKWRGTTRNRHDAEGLSGKNYTDYYYAEVWAVFGEAGDVGNFLFANARNTI